MNESAADRCNQHAGPAPLPTGRASPDADLSRDPITAAFGRLPRPAWVELDLAQLNRNLQLIVRDKPAGVRFMSIVKDQAYGHGALNVARSAVGAGAEMLGVNTLDEALELRQAGLDVPILMLGERHPEELPACLEHDLTASLGEMSVARELNRLACASGRRVRAHLKVDTGMSRYGVPWPEAAAAADELAAMPGLRLEGIMTHFAMSDEADKSFARLQLTRFQEVLAELDRCRRVLPLRHLCNTGGFLDLPEAHYDLVRVGILALGVYPSAVCRRIPGVEPVMSVKAQIVSLRDIRPGDTVGYGLRYRAVERRRIGVLPLGYGDGYPRLRNTGHVLVRGVRAPIVGSVAMDSIMVDLTAVGGAQLGDEAVVLGRQGQENISARDIADWANTVGYQILAGWRQRLPRRRPTAA